MLVIRYHFRERPRRRKEKEKSSANRCKCAYKHACIFAPERELEQTTFVCRNMDHQFLCCVCVTVVSISQARKMVDLLGFSDNCKGSAMEQVSVQLIDIYLLLLSINCVWFFPDHECGSVYCSLFTNSVLSACWLVRFALVKSSKTA